MGKLERVPGVQNWVDRLSPAMKARWHKSILYRCAVHLVEKGMSPGHAIASAVNWCKSTLATGDVKNWPGPQRVNPKSLAEIASALATWEAMKAEARASKG